jgi:hypothetical protein
MSDNEIIIEILTQYFAYIDERNFEQEFKDLFAEDAVVQKPHGFKVSGPEDIAKSAKESFVRFKATQHLPSSFLIKAINDNEAEYRANIVAMHLWAEGFGDNTIPESENYFLAGGVLRGTMTKSDDKWRIQTTRNDVVWRKGVGFQEMLKTK